MKITEKHRIRYKHVEAPGEPVEMAIYRDDIGDFRTTTGDIVADDNGEPTTWVKNMMYGTSEHYVGEIIPPPLEPYVGMVVESPEGPKNHLVCYRADSPIDGFSDWVSGFGQHHREPYVLELMERAGWKVREATDE